MSTTSYAAVAVTARREASCIADSAPVYCVALVARPRSRSHRVSGRSSGSRAGSTGTPAALTDHTVSNDGSSPGSKGAATSSTSCPSSDSSAVADS